MWVLVLQRIAVEFVFDVVYFPLWWYTSGLKRVGLGCLRLMQQANMNLAPGLWLRNIFVPMFGQTDWQGRLTSVFMRAINVIGRGIALVVATIFIIHLFLFWLALPVFVVYMLGQSFFE